MEPESVATLRNRIASAEGDALEALIAACVHDARPGVVRAVASAERRLARDRRESARLEALCALERELAGLGATLIAGVDEVGRGALAGPVTAAAVVLPPGFLPRGLIDSKQLDADTRARFDRLIRSSATACCVAHVAAPEIDTLGIAGATLEAMRRAIAGLGVGVDHVLVDGLPVALGLPTTAVVKGDVTVRPIAAASIVAKVARDALMVEYASTYAEYGFEGNKGYGSAGHLAALRMHGPCAIHRRSFAPCAQPTLF